MSSVCLKKCFFLLLSIIAISTAQQCNVQPCDDSCYYHGTCQTNGDCICSEGWSGDDCSIPTCGICDHGNCDSSGICECFPGWSGPTCDIPYCLGVHPCCNLYGWCNEEDVMPDLIIDEPSVQPRLEVMEFDICDCAVDEGCTDSGTRLLLRFATLTQNIGTADLQVGKPGDDLHLWEWHACHGHSHFKNFANFDLVGENGVVGKSHKSGFCLVDTFSNNGEFSRFFDCDEAQGLQMGWTDVYGSTLDCQWVDVTNIDGTKNWSLEMEINPEHILPESNFDNNLLRYPLTCDDTCDTDISVCLFGTCVCKEGISDNSCVTVSGIGPFLPIESSVSPTPSHSKSKSNLIPSRSHSSSKISSPNPSTSISGSKSVTRSVSSSQSPSENESNGSNSFFSSESSLSTDTSSNTFSDSFTSTSDSNSEQSTSNSISLNITYLFAIRSIVISFIFLVN